MQNTLLKYNELAKSFFQTNDFTQKKNLFNQLIEFVYSGQTRDFEWRSQISDYRVFISEVMLQQTQTSRVAEKFPQFIAAFPDFKSLAESSLHQVLSTWNGLGYNRRGRFLYEAAQKIMHEHEGKLPCSVEALDALPGIGINTAGSILAFARNEPTIFLETNIKAVLIFYFFPDQENVHDRQLLALLPELLDKQNARKWYYAMMDHGVWLKKEYVNPTRKSSSYKKQSPFHGSVRQVRGAIIRFLLAEKESTEQRLFTELTYEKELCEKALQQLITEKLIQNNGLYLKIS